MIRPRPAVGESVRVDVLSWNGVGEKAYVIVGAN